MTNYLKRNQQNRNKKHQHNIANREHQMQPQKYKILNRSKVN